MLYLKRIAFIFLYSIVLWPIIALLVISNTLGFIFNIIGALFNRLSNAIRHFKPAKNYVKWFSKKLD